MSNSSIWPIDGTLSGTTTAVQSGPGSNVNEGVLHIPQISRAGTSPSDCSVPYLGHSLQRCSRCILQPQLTGLSMRVVLLRIVAGVLGTVPKSLKNRLGGAGDQKKNPVHRLHYTVKINKNTQKGPGDHWRLAVTWLKLVRKTRKKKLSPIHWTRSNQWVEKDTKEKK